MPAVQVGCGWGFRALVLTMPWVLSVWLQDHCPQPIQRSPRWLQRLAHNAPTAYHVLCTKPRCEMYTSLVDRCSLFPRHWPPLACLVGMPPGGIPVLTCRAWNVLWADRQLAVFGARDVRPTHCFGGLPLQPSALALATLVASYCCVMHPVLPCVVPPVAPGLRFVWVCSCVRQLQLPPALCVCT